VSVSPAGVHGQVLAACGFKFTVAADATDMPDAGAWTTRAPVAAELCEVPVQVVVAEAPPLCDLDIGEFGAYRFAAAQDRVWIRRPAQDPAWQIEALHGPVLLHALAQRGVFVLHASAVRTPAGALVAFTASSGVGKSTLARVAAERGWQRVADDLLPIANPSGTIVALPHFAQPKLEAGQQYPADSALALPLTALIHVARGRTTSFEDATARQVTDLVLSSTVATRVFAGQSLMSHLVFAAFLTELAAAGQLIVGRLALAQRQLDVDEAADEALKVIEATVNRKASLEKT
jgi:hypothetical protein